MPLNGYAEYVKDARAKRIEPPDGFEGVVFEARRNPEELPREAPRTKHQAALPAKIVLERVARAAGCSISELKLVRMGRVGNPGRIAAAYALIYEARLNHQKTAALLDMSLTDVSRCLQKVREVRPGQEKLRSILEQLKEWKS